MKRKNLVNEVFGKLKVVEEVAPYISPKNLKIRKWKCLCECGQYKEVLQNALTAGLTKSCGCSTYLNRGSKSDITNNLRVGCNREDSRYNVWSMMVQRCYEENHEAYESYGMKGKLVCDRWLEKFGKGFKNFCEDLGERPKGFKLDRIDNELGYSPSNCRWVSDDVSVFNRGISRNNTSGCKGVTWAENINLWQAQLGFQYKNIILGYYDDWFDAVCARKSGELVYYKELM